MQPHPKADPEADNSKINSKLVYIAWVLTGILVFAVFLLTLFVFKDQLAEFLSVPVARNNPLPSADLPELTLDIQDNAVSQRTGLLTIIPNRARAEILNYKVEQGDSVFEIADKFNLQPETVLWANYDQLEDNPHLISPDMELQIPPVDGVLYEWQENDSFETVAANFKTLAPAVVEWPGNNLDLTDPHVEPGTLIMVPGGEREFQQWLIPTIPRGEAGVSPELYGAGACSGSFEGAVGAGAFAWPVHEHYLSGNDYWSGHLGLDIAAGSGAPVYASDSGVVVFAGWANYGYGNTVMIDHGNGYQTLYAHLNSVAVGCGQSVGRGNTIAAAGSTGYSTGAHLHFEVRYQGGFISPWFVLPAP